MKKLLSITLAALMLFALIPSIAITSYAANEQNYGKLGDINSDGDIDQYDYIRAKRIHFNTYTPSAAEKVRGDINNDGENDQYDYILIKRHHFGTYVISSTSVVVSTKALKKIYDFSEGLAWITYTTPNSNVETLCIIDTTGKILYEQPYNHNILLRKFSGGVCYISHGDEDLLFNSKGKLIASTSQGQFDSVVGCGDGIFLVYKNRSTISTISHVYAVLDENGNQLTEFVDLGRAPDDSTKYIGSGIFVIQGSNYKKLLFNYKTKKTIYIYSRLTPDYINYVNGAAYISGTFSVSDTGVFSSIDDGYYALDTDFKLTEFDEHFNYVTDGVTVQTNGYLYPTVEYFSITDRKTNITSQITEFPDSQIYGVEFNGDYGIILIAGKDNKDYFALIDRKANFQFDPICGVIAFYANGYIRFTNADGTWGIANTTGKILANNLNYKQIEDFDTGLAVALNNNNERFYINTAGEKVNIILH